MKSISFKRFFFILIASLLFANFVFSGTPVRNPKWAKPVINNRISNFYMVNENIYRGAQPYEAGFLELKKMGIKTVVNLTMEDIDKAYVDKLSLRYFHLPVDPWKPDKSLYKKFLELINDESNYPIFVHCTLGSDRAGVAIALYRISAENWTEDEALDEMVNGGYGFHAVFQDLIKFVREFDKDK